MEFPGYVPKSGRTTTRMRSSANGNPRFRVTFDDGTSFPTAKDASCAFRIENSDYDGNVWVKLFKGEIVDIQPREDAS